MVGAVLLGRNEMSASLKALIIMIIATALTIVFEIPVSRELEIEYFSGLVLMYLMSQMCLMIAGAAIGFRLALGLAKKKAAEEDHIAAPAQCANLPVVGLPVAAITGPLHRVQAPG